MRRRKGGEVEWERIYVKVKEPKYIRKLCIPPALPAEVLTFTVIGIAFSPVFCTNSIKVPLSSFTV